MMAKADIERRMEALTIGALRCTSRADMQRERHAGKWAAHYDEDARILREMAAELAQAAEVSP